jgi:hypothetical protein
MKKYLKIEITESKEKKQTISFFSEGLNTLEIIGLLDFYHDKKIIELMVIAYPEKELKKMTE